MGEGVQGSFAACTAARCEKSAFSSIGTGSVCALELLFVQLRPDVKGLEAGAAQHGDARRVAGDLGGQQAMQVVGRGQRGAPRRAVMRVAWPAISAVSRRCRSSIANIVLSANSRMTSPFSMPACAAGPP